ANSAQTVFQIQPQPAPGALEYTIEIDGQQLRYRNTQAQWTNFIWPNPQGTPGARVTAQTYDGRTIEVASQPGRFGLERLINSAQRKRKDNGVFELSWTNEGVTVVVNLKIISSAEVSGTANGPARGTASLRGLKLPETIAGGAPAPTPAGAAPMQPMQPAQPMATDAAAPQSNNQPTITGVKQ
ncbi:type VI secretion IcmF C-terminal domain-containing protein, partial [Herbaspirillum seropedicae]